MSHILIAIFSKLSFPNLLRPKIKHVLSGTSHNFVSQRFDFLHTPACNQRGNLFFPLSFEKGYLHTSVKKIKARKNQKESSNSSVLEK